MCQELDPTGLSLTPADMTVQLDGSGAPAISFTATATTAQGEVEVAGSDVTWSVSREDDTDPGRIGDGAYQPNPQAGGTVTVRASLCGLEATATVTFVLTGTFGKPSDPSAWAGKPVPGDAQNPAPSFVYPHTETRFSRNIYRYRRSSSGAARATPSSASSLPDRARR